MNNLLPDKYTDINNCLLTKASFMTKTVVDNKKLSVYDLYSCIKNKFNYLSDEEFIFALDILFIYDKIFYDLNNDLVRYHDDN